MKQLTEQERQALIKDCHQEIELLQKNLTTWGCVWESFFKSKIKRQEIALAALTAEPASKWIACNERMPEVGSDVLVTNLHGEVEVACYQKSYIPGEPFFATTAGEVYPTHWMPLPEAPAPGGETC
ncbi:DUF551 domain-containing protein [Pantoea sp. FN060301]|uniref:DUF551 domain-containing protein n=1 Tax=Pantoea sp. FN060301 TaxID=3420380 RepID=UPI003D181BB0